MSPRRILHVLALSHTGIAMPNRQVSRRGCASGVKSDGAVLEQ